MELVKTYTVTKAWDNQTLGKPSYIIPTVMDGIQFGDPHKMCFMVFTNNTLTSPYKVDMMFFSMIAQPSNTTNSNAGGILRGGYTGTRSMDLANNTYVAAGTVIKVYMMTIPTT